MKKIKKMKKLNVLALLTEDSAVGYYRMYQPMKMMESLGLINLKITPGFTWGIKKSETTDFPNLEWFSSDKGDGFIPDIIVGQRHDYLHYVSLVGGLAKGYNVPLVIDTDDDVQAVRPFNPGYASYHPDSDNLIANIKLMSIPHLSAITTSTPHLKERHEQYGKPVYVAPNSIDIKTRTFPRTKENKKIRIGWIGSACHFENLQIIQQAVKDIVANYPNVEFVFTNLYGDLWNNPPKEIADRVIPVCKFYGCKERHGVCQKAYTSFDKYAKSIAKLNLDIGLAPLKDNLFNRSKSNLRILEYWGQKTAVIASRVRPYSETIHDGVDGFLATEKLEWYRAIEKLVLDKRLRKEFGELGYTKLCKEYNAETNAKRLFKTYQEIVRTHARRKRTT